MSRYIEGFKVKYKTEICKNWQVTGRCEYEAQCSFAHGLHELKQKRDIHKNYKTKQCKRFHKERFCPYGTRCQFLHDELHTEAERDSTLLLSAKQVKVVKAKLKNKKPQKMVAAPVPAIVEDLEIASAGSLTDEEAVTVFNEALPVMPRLQSLKRL